MNRSDRRTAYAAMAVCLLALVGFLLLTERHQAPSPTEQRPKADTNVAKVSRSTRTPHYYAQPQQSAVLFPFDPNTADSTQLLQLGLQPWQVRNIYRYRSRGGIYRRKEDFARLYGLTVKDYRRLEPYIRISSDYLPAATVVDKFQGTGRDTVHGIGRDTLRYPVKLKQHEHVVLNTADTTQLKRVPGIGSYYAREIERYGRWLGGYVSIDQLDEIDGLPPTVRAAVKQYFVISEPHPQRLNVNQLTIDQLRRHPYINYHQAKALVNYRREHGAIHDLHELRLSKDFTPEAIQRLLPYVCYE